MEREKKRIKLAQALAVLVAIVGLYFVVLLASSVARDLFELRSAKRDTVQWTLSQVEIEFLDLYAGLTSAIRESQSGETDLISVRKDFDIFYSRIAIVSEAQLFTDAQIKDDFRTAIGEIQGFLDRTVTFIDGSDAQLLANLPQITSDAEALRGSVRSLFVTGLTFFAAESDELRSRLSNTILQLSGAAGIVLVLLGVLTLYSRAANQQLRSQSEALVSANARMQTILSTSLDGVIVSDVQGRVVDFNEAAEKIFGYKAEDAKGQLIANLVVPPELRDAHQKGMERMHRTGQKKLVGQGHIQINACRADGSIFPVELALQSAESDDGEIVIAFMRDISERVQAEEELRTARDQALAGEKAKADFLAVMSHEIRTPLNGLLGNLTLLGDTQMSGEQEQYRGNMEISGRLLMKHVNDVLDIARFESGKMPIRLTKFHLGELMQEILDGQSSRAENNQTAMAWNWIGAPVSWIRSDRNHIEQILLNLVGNAIKFTRGGRVDIEVEAHGDMVDFRVIDTGVGIAEEDQDRIFVDFESNGGGSGTGLGLGIAKRLTTLLKGDIGVESTLGEGSVFWVSIPLEVVAEPTLRPEKDAVAAPSRGLHILLAEDNEMNAFVAQKMLENEGHKVEIVEDGLLAIEAVTQTKYDVVLMDINMPRMDGLTATQRIRADIPEAKSLPILAFSANVLPEDKDRFMSNGMDGFIGKPILIEELRSALEAVTSGELRLQHQPEQPPSARNEARDLLGDNYDKFLARFMDEAQELVAWIIAGDTPASDVQHRCHKLVSTAAMFGATELKNALRVAETSAKRGESNMHLKDVIKAWEEARETLS